ncbi:MAG: ATP-dependent RecD-like DNA helicase [Holosporales bacterium]|jgi:exodeoxyribonuclease V alpha subunit|nr:ATP-dependent RecD-like DNA helicase [Holosporales bacterium]
MNEDTNNGVDQKQIGTITLKGEIECITFQSNGFVVAKVKTSGNKHSIPVVGNIPNPTPGSILNMRGTWFIHPKFGQQFKIVECTCTIPASAYGIEKYLGSGLIKGIGPSIARKIVKIFGDKTLEVIENSTTDLLKIDGIGAHRIEMIKKAWQDQKEIRNVMIFLQSCDISTAYATKIYRKYENDSIAIVKENPYRLVTDIFGIGFLTADNIARKLGVDEQSPIRAEAGVLFVLQEFANDGHVYCLQYELIKKAMDVLKINEDTIQQAIKSLKLTGRIVIELFKNSPCVFLYGYHFAEVKVTEKLLSIASTPRQIKSINSTTAIEWIQKKLSIVWASKQRDAIKAAITEKLLVITGSPGTGKTTIIRGILEILSTITSKIVLTAPTGRAAKRLSETTGREAKTIHRLLEYADGSFQRNENNPIDCDFIILDETSMVDILLMHHLLKTVPNYATFIMIGDINQLPSVGAGSVLKDIINSGQITVVQLNEIFRQAQKSMIVVNAHKIISGIVPNVSNANETDFYFVKEIDVEKIKDQIVSLVNERIPRKFGFNSLSDIQVLTPMHRGIIGTAILNESIQNVLNPSGIEIIRGDRKYRVGDKVMQIRNNYDKDVFNGDIGFITKIDTEDQLVFVKIDERLIRYEYLDLDELVLAYAISIHKSQGSEYPAVIIPLSMSHYIMLQRNLIYTGITRGKKLVIIVGDMQALATAVNNNKTMERNTLLNIRLQHYLHSLTTLDV